MQRRYRWSKRITPTPRVRRPDDRERRAACGLSGGCRVSESIFRCTRYRVTICTHILDQFIRAARRGVINEAIKPRPSSTSRSANGNKIESPCKAYLLLRLRRPEKINKTPSDSRDLRDARQWFVGADTIIPNASEISFFKFFKHLIDSRQTFNLT